MKTRPSSIPLYSLTDVARYSRAQHQLVRRLYLGYRDGDVVRSPLLTATEAIDRPAPLSFEDLIETALIAALRARRISLQAIREAHRLQRDAARPERRDERGLDEILERERRRAIDGLGGREQRRPDHVTVAIAKVQPAHKLMLRSRIPRDIGQ